MGRVVFLSGAEPAPGFAHAAETWLYAHAHPAAWAPGTAVKYRQTLSTLAGQLATTSPATAADIAQLDTPDGSAGLAGAFTAAFGTLAPATRARHLAALRSALAWWRERGWLAGDPAAGWARPKVTPDRTRALTRGQIAALWRLDAPLREKTLWRLLYETAGRAEEILSLNMLTALGDLSPRQRACMVLRYYQDLPIAQVASALGVAEGTVKRYLSEAMTQLAARLAPMESE